ncbi:MAG: SMP-30/gluconolactonase/LRE family protein [Planctomycetes bacterium]|nr:SMP-30/gluconolactonase/LRE family protein [Planctomycetota bacterium]
MRRIGRFYLTLGWAVLLAASIAAADLPSLSLHPAFSDLTVTPLRLNGPCDPAGTTGLEVLPRETVINNQVLPAGTILAMLGTVVGGDDNRVYAVDPIDGHILPDLSVSYGPAAGTGRPDAGMVLAPESETHYLGMQYSPMAVFLGEFEADGPGLLHNVVNLPAHLFPNGGGLGLADDDTLYITSWETRSLYAVDFDIVDNELTLGQPTLLGRTPAGAGPDGVAVIPPNAAGGLADYAGNLILARFSGIGDGLIDIIDTQGGFVQRVARYHKNDATGFIGPDGLTFGPDGTLFVSDFDQTIFKIAVPEPAGFTLLVVGLLYCGRRRP